MKLLNDAQEAINNLPILLRWGIYVGIAIGLYKTIPWLLDGVIIVMTSLLFLWCIFGVSSDSYNTLIASLNEAKEKIVKDLAESLKDSKTDDPK
jgi:divalent metal cation (Fe/Co/Zn/Cd) transporter